eukprot:CAMPEP_0172483500 /NCGR_PEP_ID=MMETSP1066-20121228/10507_1 /TAXON_ID=671091 /ORGANISM="Coscinodiscus wailesii, Strain CCMP2513" /LENGTH=790 /DNA_ID=CAMNT_0013247405 /DNA_START=89 /DNA_END=2461 /DNA_ORIENTATION=-
MSLATAGGGGMGGGGMSAAVMAHNTAAMPHQHTQSNFQSNATSAAAAAPKVDQLLHVSSKQMSSAELYPLVAIDLFDTGHVRFVPPLAAEGQQEEPCVIMDVKETVPTQLRLKRTEASYKALKKMLSKGDEASFLRVFSESLSLGDDKDDNDDVVVTIPTPALLLGVRRINHLPPAMKEMYPHKPTPSSAVSAAIEPVVTPDDDEAYLIRDQTLDGEPTPRGNDYDRVGIQLNLLPGKKKPLVLLPEDAALILLNYGRKLVHDEMRRNSSSSSSATKKKSKKKIDIADDSSATDETSGWSDYPISLPLPLAARTDPCTETLYEMGITRLTNRAGMVLTGSFILQTKGVIQAIGARYRGIAMEDEDEDGVAPTVYVVGRNAGGVDITAVRVTQPSETGEGYEDYGVVSEVSARTFEEAWEEIGESVGKYCEEGERTPCAVILYGTSEAQAGLAEKVRPLVKGMKVLMPVDKRNTKEICPLVVMTDPTVVAVGCAAGFGQAYQRLGGSESHVRNASATAVAISMNYEGEVPSRTDEENIKILFDFDRRVPAGPYQIDFTAAECAAIRHFGTLDVTPEQIKTFQGFKNIPKREDAARKIRLQVLQKTRGSDDWVEISSEITPLWHEDEKYAIESCCLEVSLRANGEITTRLVGEGTSIVQANKEARKSTISYYMWTFFAILFFGGFLFKSWYEDYVFQRDTKRLLAYYKHVIPGSLSDGDLHNARYLVWKYRYKKKRLWKGLEVKYGEPVPETWPDDEEEEQEEDKEDEEEIDLDANEEEDKNDGKQSEGDEF